MSYKFNPLTANLDYYQSGGSGVQSVVAGTNISVDSTDAANPIVSTTGLATVATTGAYSDLSGTPTIPTSVDTLGPSQTGNAGLYLTTDGTNASWAAAGGGASSSVNYDVIVDAAGGGDYTTLTAAFAALAADYTTILVRAGTYNESTLSTTYNYIRVHGEGRENTRLTMTGAGTISGTNLELRDLSINSSTFFFNISGGNTLITHCNLLHARSNGYSFYLSGYYNEVSSCYIVAASTTTRFFTGNRSRFVNNHMIYSTANTGSNAGLMIASGVIADNYFYRYNTTTSGNIIAAAGASGPTTITGNTVIGNGCIFVYSGTNNPLTIVGNTAYKVSCLLDMTGIGNITVNDNTFFGASPGTVISQTGTGLSTISGNNLVTNNSSAITAIYVGASAGRAIVTGNTVEIGTTSTSLGINILNAQSIVNSNIVRAAFVGITIGAGSTNSVVTSNINSACTTAINDLGTTTTLANNTI